MSIVLDLEPQPVQEFGGRKGSGRKGSGVNKTNPVPLSCQSGRRSDGSVTSDRLQQARYGGLESSERPKLAGSNHFKVDQLGEGCLVAGRFVASVDDGVEPSLRVPRTCFEISLGRFRIASMRRPSGNRWPAKEATPAISHVSYSCLAKTTATENVSPPRHASLRRPAIWRPQPRKTPCLRPSRCRHRESATPRRRRVA